MATTTNDGSGATDVSGTWSDEANAYDGSGTTYATANGTTTTHTLDITGFDFGSVVGAGDTLTSVSVNVSQYVSDVAFSTPTIQAFVGSTAIGSPISLTKRTSAGNEDITLTGLTLADIRDAGFKVRFNIAAASSAPYPLWPTATLTPSATLVPSEPTGQSFADDFNRANEQPPTGWYAVTAGLFTVTSNQLQPSGSSTQAMFDSACDTANNFSQVTIATWDTGGFAGVNCRGARSGTRNEYFWRLDDTTDQVQLFKVVSGSSTALGSAVSQAGVAGQTLRIEASGSTITGYLGGTQSQQATDTAVTTGTYCGIRAGYTNARLDDWSGGDI